MIYRKFKMQERVRLRLFTEGALLVISGSCCTGGFAAGIGAAGRLLAQLLLLLRPLMVLLRLALA